MPRRLRIAASLFFAVLTIALWVRSYWYSELVVTRKTPTALALGTIKGRLVLGSYPQGSVNNRREWYLDRSNQHSSYRVSTLGFEFDPFGDVKSIMVPFWFMLAAIAANWLPVIWPSFRWQFSLRALFITTTLVALALGLGVWLTR